MTNNPHITGFKVLIVDDIHPVFIDSLLSAGGMVDYKPEITYADTLECIADYDGLVLRSKFKVRTELIDAASNLKLIARAGAGVDNIDVNYAESKGIQLISAPEGNCDAVAEHMLGMLLSLLNNLRTADLEITKEQWKREENRGFELGGKVVGLLGYGNNGKAMARKLSGFGVKVLAYDKLLDNYGDEFAEEASMDRLFQEADVLSLHIPLTPDTRSLVNAEFISCFRKAIYFLNGSRGEIADMKAIVEGLKNASITGAALDVLPVEKFPDLLNTEWFDELTSFPNVILSPHIAGWTVESYFKIAKFLAEKFVKALELQRS